MFTTRPELLCTFGAVASTHWLASQSGMAVLEKGGNAFDAAVAAGFVLQVVEPHLNGPGGEAPMIVHSAAEGRTRVVCGQGTAPAAATIEHYRRHGHSLMPGTGLLAAVVPGAFDAWLMILRDYGTMSFGEVMEFAIGYAENGFPVVPRITWTIESVEALFRDHWPSSAEVWLRDGAPQPGRLFRTPAIAATFKRLVAESATADGGREAGIEAARHAWYEGFVAEAIDRFCRDRAYIDTTGTPQHGVMTGDDLARWHATYEDPLTYDYHGHTICKTGPWGQGPVMLQQLALLRGFDIATMNPTGPDFIHTVVECAKLAYADREAYYGDPDFVDVPMTTLLDDAHNGARRELVGERANPDLRPGTIPGHDPWTDDGAAERAALKQHYDALGGGEPTIAKTGASRGDTCHVDVIDRWGNMVSATPSGGWLQSSPTIPELGFNLTNRGQMFWLDEGHPASLAPGKRPRTTLTPSFALRDGAPYMAFGTPGGDQQDQWALIFLLHHIDHGMNLQEAIDCPTFQTVNFPSSFFPRERYPNVIRLEGRFSDRTVEELRRRGHIVEIEELWSLGRLSAAARDGDLIKAAANPRGMQGYAVGR
ncbi:MAG: gamma-glutamyltransferase family protein [Alphaproteobacteria bacterium]|nr:gamma-glutamyltransferase family protein [Alphaproteobacteria bacterium]